MKRRNFTGILPVPHGHGSVFHYAIVKNTKAVADEQERKRLREQIAASRKRLRELSTQ